MPTCPSEDELLQLTSGDLSRRRERAVQAHLRTCNTCRELLHRSNRALHLYRMYGHDPADRPQLDGFGAKLFAQHQALRHSRRWTPPQRWWSLVAATVMVAAAITLWYRYTEVPLSAEVVLTGAIAHEQQRTMPATGTVLIRRLDAHQTANAAESEPQVGRLSDGSRPQTQRTSAAESDRAAARELAQRLRPYAFDATVPLSARPFQQWRQRAPDAADHLRWLAPDLIRVTTTSAHDAVRRAEIVVRSPSYEPIAQTWRFSDGFEAEITHVPHLPTPASSAPEVVAAAPSVPPTVTPRDLELVEINARAALHRLGVPVSGIVSFNRVGDHVRIAGAAPSPDLVQAVTRYAGRHPGIDARIRLEPPSAVDVPIAHAPAFQSWLESAFADEQRRAEFVPRAADLAHQLRRRVQELSTLAERYPPTIGARLSPEAQANLQRLAAAQYRDTTTAYEALEQHFAALAGVSRPLMPERLPNDWQRRATASSAPFERLSSGLTHLLTRPDLHTPQELRTAARDAVEPPLAELAALLADMSARD